MISEIVGAKYPSPKLKPTYRYDVVSANGTLCTADSKVSALSALKADMVRDCADRQHVERVMICQVKPR